MRPLLLDLYCGQGGAAKGYVDAGFDVIGVDIVPQPRYPYRFVQGHALDVLRSGWGCYDAIHASPPCQAYSHAQRIQDRDHPSLIAPTRDLLEATGLPYVIENVMGARDELFDPIRLCGAMFPPLRVYRHRLFESNFKIDEPPHPAHVAPQVKMGRKAKPGEWLQVVGNFSGAAEAREAMGMPWASRDGLREAIPPAYTEYIGRYLRLEVERGFVPLPILTPGGFRK